MLIISKEEVRRLLPVKDAIELVGKAYVELGNGTAEVPDRIGVSSRGDGTTLVMPGYLGETDSMAVKMVSVFPKNSIRELPAIHALVIVFDPETGIPLAAIEGGYLTALRTGASCGLATKHLARANAASVAIIGAGAQSRLILPAVCSVRDIEEVFVFDMNGGIVAGFIEEMTPGLRQVNFVACGSSREAVRNAGIVCTATTSVTPVFNGGDLPGGTHINGIGSFTPEMQEVDFETLKRCSKIVVDSYGGAMAEAGDLLKAIDQGIIARDEIYCEIGSIVEGAKPGRENLEELTFFKSVGNAALDVVVGAEVLRRAVKSGAGTNVDMFGDC
jgi:ornithine cyclodeaminase/alanine dehydrogenase-like protein (mu-crystallin family)